jgi:hypothetical protein
MVGGVGITNYLLMLLIVKIPSKKLKMVYCPKF